jgi:hypothetical protein
MGEREVLLDVMNGIFGQESTILVDEWSSSNGGE